MLVHVFLYCAATCDSDPLADMHFSTLVEARAAAMIVAHRVPQVHCFVVESDDEEIERWVKAAEEWRCTLA